MKIAIYHNIPSDGAKRALYEQVKLLSRNHIIDFYYLSSNKETFLDLRKITNKNFCYHFIAVHRFRFFSILYSISFLIEYVLFLVVGRRIAKDIDSRNYDVVFIYQCEFSHVTPLTKYLKTKTVLYCQEPWRRFYEPKMYVSSIDPKQDNKYSNILIYKFLEKIQSPLMLCLKFADRRNIKKAGLVLCNSYYSQEYIKRSYGVNAEINYLGINEQGFTNLKLLKKNYLLSVGALDVIKGYDFIITACSFIPKKIRPKLIILGDRNSRSTIFQYLNKLAKDLAVELEMKKNVDNNELIKYYNECKIFVYAPIREPFGLIALEAMACGTPVVGVNEAGLKETIINNINGKLTARNAQQFAEAITLLLQNNTEYSKLASQARNSIIPKFTWEASVKNLESLFQKYA